MNNPSKLLIAGASVLGLLIANMWLPSRTSRDIDRAEQMRVQAYAPVEAIMRQSQQKERGRIRAQLEASIRREQIKRVESQWDQQFPERIQREERK